ncbi:hypothetical protein LQV63_20120 [Paenibacillus profundus]|uniref:Uncharacterized protein n=1 Tax=Paenibacillus profundus TaxID=1173085 RepID=A0ABS8YK99_9BACL|nr:hypothetical protein [Paenibacillus profundus]
MKPTRKEVCVLFYCTKSNILCMTKAELRQTKHILDAGISAIVVVNSIKR